MSKILNHLFKREPENEREETEELQHVSLYIPLSENVYIFTDHRKKQSSTEGPWDRMPREREKGKIQESLESTHKQTPPRPSKWT